MPDSPRAWGALVDDFTSLSIGPVRPLMRLLLAAVGLVLLIACGNVANLLLPRAASERGRELVELRARAWRGPRPHGRQLLAESVLVGLGGLHGRIRAPYPFFCLLPASTRKHPASRSILDLRVLFIAIAASLLTSLLAGLMPAIGASRLELTEFLKSHASRGSASGHSRLQSSLIRRANRNGGPPARGCRASSSAAISNVESVDTGFTPSAVTFHVSLDQAIQQAPNSAPCSMITR